MKLREKLGFFVQVALSAVLILTLGTSGISHAQPAPAGALIENQARISYFNELLGIYESIPTNTVITVVNEVPAIEVIEDRVTYLTPDTVGAFAYFVRNTGNTPLDASLALTQQAGDDYDLLDVAIFVDLNGNGIVDPGDQPVLPGASYPIDVGGELGVIVQFRTPAVQQDGDAALIDLVATDAPRAVSDGATGTVLISTTGLALQKEVNFAEAAPGDTLRYTLELRNRGTNDMPGYTQIYGETIRIDGTSALPGILVRDSVPLNTTFSQVTTFNETQGFELLYHVVGASISDHDYFTALPAGSTLADVDAIAFFREGDYPVSYSSDFVFEVTIAENVADTYIPNTAETWQDAGGEVEEIESNPVRTRVNGVPGVLDYTDPNGTVIFSTGLDTNVRLQLNASACNRDGGLAETVFINIATTPEGDLETVSATETGPNTGLFTTTNIPVQNEIPPVQQNGVLSGDRASVAQASIVCGRETITATVVINPGGYVFNSASNVPISGAEVVLFDSNGNQLDSTFTDVDGFYVFDETRDGVYEIEVYPLAQSEVVFPSQRTLFPGWDRNVDANASYGLPFSIPGDLPTPFFGIDIPLDPDTNNALVLTKDVEPDIVSPGEIVIYTLTLENRRDIAIANTTIYDQMPDDLTYIDGSARVRGDPIDVDVAADGSLTFNIGDVFRRESIEITYAATVDPLADGRLVNTAYADGQYYGDGLVRSNDAQAVVRVARDRGVFSDRGVILGTVYVDFNRNGIQDTYISADGTQLLEPGIPGVRIYFENGAHVVTDVDGRYSMPGMTPRLHIAAVSLATLPESVQMHVTTTRDAFMPQSRMIRLRPGEVAAEYFATIPREGQSRATVLAELAVREEAFLERGGVVGPYLPNVDGDGAPQSTDFVNGGGGGTAAAYTSRTGILVRADGVESAYALLPEAQQGTDMVVLERTRNLEAIVRQLSPDLGFIDLSSNDTVNDDIVSIRVKGPANGRLGLSVNGDPVSNDRIGQRVASGAGVQAIEYVAIRLRPGVNTLELTYSDPFGNVRQTRQLTISAPGASDNVQLIAPPTAYANPATPIPVLVRITDAEGLPTGVSMDITLESSNGSSWGARDLRPSEPGLQVFIDNGEALIDYYPPELPGTHTIRVRNGLGRFSTDILLEPDAGERIIVGFVEGVLGIGEDDVETDNLVGYDETITGINGALYLRGRIRGDAILTLRYDSDEDSAERLFRDVDPQAYYPVYGDASERGYDAQSNSQLYVRIDQGSNYILYGDITMGPQSEAIQLGGYSRSLTGIHAHYENGPVRVDIMAGRTDRTQLIREFRAEGVSGPYDLDLGDYLDGSERVEIVTRDLRRPSTIVSTVALQRYVDYRLDFFNDSIIFDVPVPASDDEGNPNFIRVTYESNDGADDYWLYSGEVSYDINDRFTVGYREIRSEADAIYDDRRTVRSGFAEAGIGENGELALEFAQSVDNTGEEGDAARISYTYRTNDVTLSFNAARASEGFLDAGSALSSGREEISAEADWLIEPGLHGVAGLLYDRDLDTGDQRYGAEALLSYVVNPELTVNGGLRYLDRRPGDGSASQTVPSLVLGARYAPEWRPGFSIGGELEVGLSDSDAYRIGIDASDQVSERLRLYSELDYASDGAEFLDFSASSGGITSFTAGFEYRFTDQILAFSDVQSGARTGVSAGISGEWALDEVSWGRWFPGRENAILYARLEHFEPYDVDDLLGLPFGNEPVNDDAQTSFAIGSFGEYNDGQGAVRLDTEGTVYDDGYSIYARQYWAEGYGDVTWGAENRFAYATRDDAEDRLRNHLRFGLAYRDEAEVFDMLGYAGLRLEDDPQANLDSLTGYWRVGGSWAVDPDTRLTFNQAGQYTEQAVAGFEAEFLTLAQVGFDHDFSLGENMNARIGAHAGAFYDVLGGEATPNYGVEFGFIPAENVMISAGYNWSDVQATEISEVYHTGAFLRFTLTLDNNLWNLFERDGQRG